MGVPFQDDDSDVEFRDHLRPWMILVTVMIGLALGTYYGGRPAYTAYKEQKALRRVAVVEAALKAGKPETAASDLRMALSLAPGLPEVWRVAGTVPEAVLKGL